MRELIWTGTVNDAHAIGGRVGLVRHHASRRGADGRGRARPVGQARDREAPRRARHRPDRGRLPACLGRRLRSSPPVASAGLRAEVWGFSRAVPADLEALVELGVRFSVIESPISDLKLDAIGVARETMLDRITKAMRFAAEHGIHAAFFGVDSTRAERDFYRRVYSSAVEAGAREVVVVDTLGIASPEAVADLVGRTVELVGAEMPVHFHGHDDSASPPQARSQLSAPAQVGSRHDQRDGRAAGNADLGEVALTLRALYGVELEPAARLVREVSERVRELSGYELAPWKPVTGETLFRRESGAVASQFHDPPRSSPTRRTSSPPSARSCSGRRAGSTRSGSRRRSSGSTCPRSGSPRCSRGVKEAGTRKRGLVTDDEFRELARG